MRTDFVRAAVTAFLLGAGVLAAQGECVSTLRGVAHITQFPNRPAANVAWSGSVYGVVKVEPQTRSYPIYFGIADSELNPASADILVADNTLAGPIALVWTGSDFGLFYQNLINQLYLQRLDVNGKTVGGPIAVLPSRAQVEAMEYDIAWNPVLNAYAILHTIPSSLDKGLYLTTLRRDGTLLIDRLLSFQLSNDIAVTPRLAITANGSMGVLWRLGNRYTFALYPPSADVGFVPPFQIPSVATRAVLATNGSQFLVVVTTPGSGNPELHYFVLDPTGVPGSERTLLASKGADIAPISLLWNPVLHEYALVYVDAATALGVFPTYTRLRRLTSSGGTIADTEFSPDITKFDYATRYPVIFNGSAYVGEIDNFRSNAEGSEAYLVRHCPLQVAVTVDQGANVPVNSTVTLRASASGGFPGYTYFWDFGDLGQASGGSSITHRYDRIGSYTVSVTTTDTRGAMQTATFTLVISRPKPRAARH
jgi:hypothetical protein